MTMYFNEAGAWSYETVETVLRRRGHVVAGSGDVRETLFPGERIGKIQTTYWKQNGTNEVFGTEAVRTYMEHYGKTGVRKMLRKLVHEPAHAERIEVLERIAGKRFEDSMAFLEALQVVAREGDQVRLLRTVPNLGKSLEHYVAQLSLYELRGTGLWGVNLEGVGSGDFDVIAWLPPTLMYVECKAGAPADISQSDLEQVLIRTRDLAPDFTVVLVDTESDLAPVASKLGGAQLKLHRSSNYEFFLPPNPLPDYGSIYFALQQHWPIYFAGGKPSLLSQLRWCLRHYNSVAKWR